MFSIYIMVLLFTFLIDRRDKNRAIIFFIQNKYTILFTSAYDKNIKQKSSLIVRTHSPFKGLILFYKQPDVLSYPYFSNYPNKNGKPLKEEKPKLVVNEQNVPMTIKEMKKSFPDIKISIDHEIITT